MRVSKRIATSVLIIGLASIPMFAGLGGSVAGATPTGQGYWEVASDGGIFSFGGAAFHGSMGGTPLNKPIVGMAATPSGQGYWEVASDGGIFSFGGAAFHGSMGGTPLNKPIVGMVATPSGQGYWEVASDGGIFSFGDAGFFGSAGSVPLSKPIVGMAATSDGKGYWVIASDGGIFNYGDATFQGSFVGSLGPNNQASTFVGIVAAGSGYIGCSSSLGYSPSSGANQGEFGGFGGPGLASINDIVGCGFDQSSLGYWNVAADGGIFALTGGAGFYGSIGGQPLNKPIVGMGVVP